MSSIASSDPASLPVFRGGGNERALELRIHPQARRMKLSVDPRTGAVRLVLPRRASPARAIVWAEANRAWVEAALARLDPPARLAPGGTVPLDGVPHRIDWSAEAGRTVTIAGDSLRVGGPAEQIEARLLRWLRAEALRRLAAETAEVAAAAGVTVAAVSIGDPRGRWGSCAASGRIRYSWRLVMAPPAVRRSVVVHEVAHRVHMNHGPDFHGLVRRLLGRDPDAERAWLRAHGAALHRIGS